MARLWLDDLNPQHEAKRTVIFPFADAWYEVDLGDENLEKYEEALLPFMAAARKVEGGINAPTVSSFTPAPEGFTSALGPAGASARPAITGKLATVTPVVEPEPEPEPATAKFEPEPVEVARPVSASPSASEPAAGSESAPATPFATLTFEPEPDLVAVGSRGAGAAGVNGHTETIRRLTGKLTGKAGSAAAASSAAGSAVHSGAIRDLDPVPKLDADQLAMIREWAAEDERFKNRPQFGRMPKDIYWAWVEAHR